MSEASRFLAANPTFEDSMKASTAFEEVKRQHALEIDEERLYIVRGDTLGNEEDLYVETVVRGAQRHDPSDPYRQVYLELDDHQRAVIDERIGERRSESAPAGRGQVERKER